MMIFHQNIMDEVTGNCNDETTKMVIKTEVFIKPEPDDREEENSTVMNSLYADHVIKDDLVIGPEVLQQTLPNEDHRVRPSLNKLKVDVKIEEIEEEPASNEVIKSDTPSEKTVEIPPVDNQDITKESMKVFSESKALGDDNKDLNETPVNTMNDKSESYADPNQYICNDCGKGFETKIVLIQNTTVNSEVIRETYFYCDQCTTYKALSRDCTEKHTKEKCDILHTGDGSFKCTFCDYKSTRKSILQDHLLTHTGDKLHKCTVCDHKFSRKRDLTRHLYTHTGEKPFSCTFCDYKCHRRNDLNKHLFTHTGEKPYSCTNCKYKCSRKTLLKQHLLTHTGEKPHSCSVCNLNFTQKTSLKQHMLIHSGEKPYSCTVCDFKCAIKRSLTRHMFTHGGEKPYSCTNCEFKCTQRSSLKQHSLTHSGEKPYSCIICNFKCAVKMSLRRHLLTHTDEKLYNCTVCDYKCNQKYSLKQHLLTHTDEK